MKYSQVAKNPFTKIMIYGEPKTGKSTLALKLLQYGFRLTWINMDNGFIKLVPKLGLSVEQLDEQLNIINLPDTPDYPIAIETCLKISNGEEHFICDRHGKVNCNSCKIGNGPFSSVYCNAFGSYDVIVYDHVGVISKSALNAALKKRKPKEGEDLKPTWDDWGVQGLLLDRFFTGIQNARYNVICIAHVIEAEQEDKTNRLYPEIGTRNYSTNAGKFFDDVIYVAAVNGAPRYVSTVGKHAKAISGSRTDVEIEKLEKEPSLLPFFELQAAGSEGEKQEPQPEKQPEQVTETRNNEYGANRAKLLLEQLKAKKGESK